MGVLTPIHKVFGRLGYDIFTLPTFDRNVWANAGKCKQHLEFEFGRLELQSYLFRRSYKGLGALGLEDGWVANTGKLVLSTN